MIFMTAQYKHVSSGLFAARSQVPFAIARTLTALAQDGREALRKKMPEAFDRPTPFTVNGIFTKRAEKQNLVAEIYFAGSQSSRGKAPREYLRPGVDAASYARQQKKTEFLLTRSGVLPPGWVTTPGRYIADGHLDQFGNMPGSYYKQIIRNLQIKIHALKPIFKASVKRAARMGVDREFFAVAPGRNALAKGGGWLPPGVYRREGAGGSTLRQYLKFVRKASYQPRLDVRAEVEVAVKTNLSRRWNESVALITDKFKAR